MISQVPVTIADLPHRGIRGVGAAGEVSSSEHYRQPNAEACCRSRGSANSAEWCAGELGRGEQSLIQTHGAEQVGAQCQTPLVNIVVCEAME